MPSGLDCCPGLAPLEVIAIPKDHVLLGRDVLNHFYVKLNGPELTFDFSPSPL